MANPPCMSDDGNAAVFVGTMLETGDAVALCDECLVAWSAALLQVMTGIDPTPFLHAISVDEVTVEQVQAAEQAAAEPAPGPGPDPPAANGKRGRTSNGSRAAGTASDLDAEVTPTAADAGTPAA